MSNNNEGGRALATTSQKFVAAVEREFTAQMGAALKFSEHEKTLAQHLFVKVTQR